MRVTVITPRELDETARKRWHALRRVPPDGPYASPFFTPEFVAMVGQVRPATRIALVEVDGELAGFFPFERRALGLGAPVALGMSDAHGLVADARAPIDATALVRACGLSSWRFDHRTGAGRGFERHETGRAFAWRVRFDGGFAAWRAERDRAGGWLRRHDAALRRFEREHGPLRFTPHTDDDAAFDALLRWKSDQYVRTANVDSMRIPWVRRYLEAMRRLDTPACAGRLSALHAGDRLVAVHLGLRTETLWHYYLPTYDRALAPRSPGGCLLLHLLGHAAATGARVFDFGKGDADYKLALANDTLLLTEGAVEPQPMRVLRLRSREAVGRLRRLPWLLAMARWGKRGVRAVGNAMR